MPNIALIQGLKAAFPDDCPHLLYIGTRKGMERQMIGDLGVPYRGIICGKLRRYFSLRNVGDAFKFPVGILQSLVLLSRFNPDVVFCKGGYVSFPVALAGWILRKPVFLHESDVIPGLANRLSSRFATKILVSFEESKKYFPAKKVVVTGNPVRPEIAEGDRNVAVQMSGLTEKIPVLLVMGGSQGADFINQAIWRNLPLLLNHFQVVHVCGKGNMKSEDEILGMIGGNYDLLRRYRQYEFIAADLKHFYALTQVMVTRAGANSLAEIALLHKPAVLIPLSKKTSRGDQIVNAEFFSKEHRAVVMEEERFDDDRFLEAIEELAAKSVGKTVHEKRVSSATDKIISLLRSCK